MKAILRALYNLCDPLKRQLWKTSVFKFHRWFTPKLYFHCLFNIHQLGSIIHQTPDRKIFMIQHFCSTCHPEVLARMNEMVKAQRAQAMEASGAKPANPKMIEAEAHKPIDPKAV